MLVREGGYVNDPDDKGGATNKGVTQGVYDAYRKENKKPVQSVKLISDAEVSDIYYKRYWLAAGCDKMGETFALLSFDSAVNHGVGRVKQFLTFAKYKDPMLFVVARLCFYIDIVVANPSQIKFLKGWKNRILALLELIQNLNTN